MYVYQVVGGGAGKWMEIVTYLFIHGLFLRTLAEVTSPTGLSPRLSGICVTSWEAVLGCNSLNGHRMGVVLQENSRSCLVGRVSSSPLGLYLYLILPPSLSSQVMGF